MTAARKSSSSPAPSALPPAPEMLPLVERALFLLIWGGAILWLCFAAALGFVATMKFHVPGFLAEHAWSTYGRVQWAQTTALMYGFVIPGGIGVLLWLARLLGGTTVRAPGLFCTGVVLWFAGVEIGLLGIFAGHATGHEGLELPGAIAPVLFTAYALMAVSLLLTFAQRRSPTLQVSQWFVLAGIFWFPWIYSAAQVLLIGEPSRGVMQPLAAWWYRGNLITVWLGSVGLAALLHWWPQRAGRPLPSRDLAITAFWTLIFFGSWTGIPQGAPLPAWIPAVSTVFGVFTLIPVLAVGVSLISVAKSRWGELTRDWIGRLFVFSAAAWVVGSLLSITEALPAFGRITQFTFFTTARVQLLVYGFGVFGILGVIYLALPRLLPGGLPAPRLVTVHVAAVLAAVTLQTAAFAVGGLLHGLAMAHPTAGTDFQAAAQPALMALRIGTLGDLLLVIGNLALAANLVWALARLARTWCVAVQRAWSQTEPSEVAG